MGDGEMMGEDALNQARQLVREMEAGNETEARRVLDGLTRLREAELYCELGKLTRELHDALSNFRLDSRIAGLAEQEIPDARERLNYVINMTEEAANKTLGAVEESIPVSEQMQERSADLAQRWRQFRSRELSVDQFRELSRAIDEFFPFVEHSTQLVQSNLSEVLMAQGFQDLTGQIIRRVIRLVHDVEESLVDLIRLSGGERGAVMEADEQREKIKAQGPQVPGVDDADNMMQGQDAVDELLSSLGF
jgi:chemotaxis protein CheZ